jgi:Tol biopolymer transport system component
MVDQGRKTTGSRRPLRIVALAGLLWLGAILALSQSPTSTGAAEAIGTPFYDPLVMVWVPTPTPTPNPQPGRIVYESKQLENWDIWVMNANGSGKTRMTKNVARDSDATWSPDYSQIVFASERASSGDVPNREIFVMNTDGGESAGVTRLTNQAGKDYDPSWSPDGKRIAFVSKRDGDWDIYLVRPNGTNLTNLTNNKYTDTDPSWSPDGSRIAFASDRDEPGSDPEIYTMKADGTDVRRLTNNDYADGDPSWSADGTRLAFECWRDHNFEICTINVNGTNPNRLTHNEVADSDPSWQRWGEQIVFGSYRTGNGDVYMMNSDGGGVTQLTSNPYIDGDACARPSGP